MSVTGTKRSVALCVLTLSLCVAPVEAASVSIGALSFDTFVPASPGSPGVNAFDIANLTGLFALPPDFPVIDNLVFQSATLTLNPEGQAPVVFTLGDIAPGFLLDVNGNPVVQVSSDQNFLSAEFQAVLSASAFMLADGSTFTAGSTSIDLLLLPSMGPTLSVDVDQTTIAVSNVREPATWQLALIALPWLIRRLRRSTT